MNKERADRVIVEKGVAESQQKAQALIMAGLVFIDGKRIEKPGQRIERESQIFLKQRIPYVSRGGLKLEKALEEFNISVQDKVAADLGASTGGFTHCLLQRGARRVYAVDVDIRQIDYRLREDSRVICIKKNARYLRKEDFGEDLDLVTADLSFISILKVLPAIKEFLDEGLLVFLLKPQFEVERHQVGKKGIVKDPTLHAEVIAKIIGEVETKGFKLKGLAKSAVLGAKGNTEFFLCWSLKGTKIGLDKQQRLIKEAVWNEKN